MDLAARKYRLIQELVKVNDERLMKDLEKVLNLEIRSSGISAAQKKELDKRLKEHEENPRDLLDWSEVKSSW